MSKRRATRSVKTRSKSGVAKAARSVKARSPRPGAKTAVVPMKVLSLNQLARAYEGASRGKRTENWRTPSTSAMAETFGGIVTLRDRSRDLVRNNGYASQAIVELVSNHIGTGIMAKVKGGPKSQEKTAKLLWEEWAETPACDADGINDFYGLQVLIARTLYESGEVLIRRRWRRSSDGLPVPMQIQVLEPDFIDTTKNEVNDSEVIVQGIAYDKLGRRKGYWLFSEHPGGRSIFQSPVQSKFVPAADIIHLFDVLRPGQNRGIPRATPVIIKMRDFDEAQDAMGMLMKIASCFTVFITGTDDGTGDELGEDDDDEAELPDKVSPGSIYRMGAGEDIKTGNPPNVNGYAEFSDITLGAIARGYGIPKELLTGDYSKINFSSGRMSWLSFQRNIAMSQWILYIPRLCRGVWGWWKEAALVQGANLNGVTSGWTPPRREMIDPAAEFKALGYAIRLGLMSLPEAIRQLGYDPEEVMREQAQFLKLVDKLGLVLDTDPRKVTQAGMMQIETPTEKEQGAQSDEDEDAED